MSIQRPSSVWILSDGLPGHVNQSLGIAKALKNKHPSPINITVISAKLRLKFMRPLMRLAAKKNAVRALVWLCRTAYKVIDLPKETPDLIVSAGGNTLPLNITLSLQNQVANVFSGTLKGYPPALVTINFSVAPLNHHNNVTLDLPPTVIPPNSKKDNLKQASGQKIGAVFIGGQGAGYDWQPEQLAHLAEQMNQLAKKDNIQWLISTSRRTGETLEQALKNNLNAETICEAVWYGENPQPVVQAFLSRADFAMITEDSLTMIAEGIMSATPVVTLQPSHMTPIDYDVKTLEHYETKGFIQRKALSAIGTLNTEQLSTINVPDIYQQIYTPLKPFLQ